MRFLGFLIVVAIIYPISLLPMWVLYRISDVIAIVLQYVIKYRLTVVQVNLTRSFPEKSPEEISKLTRRFYIHLSDIFVETLKTFSITERQVKKWVTEENPDLIQRFYDEGKSIIAISGHFNNWEWAALRFNYTSNHKTIGIYKKITNPYFNRLMKWSRERLGVKFIEAKEVFEYFQNTRDQFIIGFLSDQWPSKTHKAYWTRFLNQETAVFPGAEKYAVDHQLPVIYGVIKKEARGKYKIKYQLITTEPHLEKPGFITEAHVRFLEKSIFKEPEYWIWSHKRWKKSKTEVLKQQEKKEITVKE